MIDLHLHEGGVAENPAQDVVEVVGDPPRQEADTLHLLLVKELLLQLLLLRHVPDHSPEVDGTAGAVFLGVRGDQDVQELTVLPLPDRLVIPDKAFVGDLLAEKLPICGGDVEIRVEVEGHHLFLAGIA